MFAARAASVLALALLVTRPPGLLRGGSSADAEHATALLAGRLLLPPPLHVGSRAPQRQHPLTPATPARTPTHHRPAARVPPPAHTRARYHRRHRVGRLAAAYSHLPLLSFAAATAAAASAAAVSALSSSLSSPPPRRLLALLVLRHRRRRRPRCPSSSCRRSSLVAAAAAAAATAATTAVRCTRSASASSLPAIGVSAAGAHTACWSAAVVEGRPAAPSMPWAAPALPALIVGPPKFKGHRGVAYIFYY